MSQADLRPLDDEVAALVRRAANIVPAPAEAKARVFARVVVNVGPPGGGGGGAGDPSSGARGASVAPSHSMPAGLVRRLLPFAASFALGGAVGGAIGATAMRAAVRAPVSSENSPRIVYVERPAVTAAVSARGGTAAEAIATENAPGDPVARSWQGSPPSLPAAPSPRAAATPGDQLARERTILDLARGALEREDGAAVLQATEQHEQRYPKGVLAQEREAMAVRALVMLGRGDEARARVARFRASFPDSVLLPALGSAVRGGSAQ
jgi:hypothetical protein